MVTPDHNTWYMRLLGEEDDHTKVYSKAVKLPTAINSTEEYILCDITYRHVHSPATKAMIVSDPDHLIRISDVHLKRFEWDTLYDQIVAELKVSPNVISELQKKEIVYVAPIELAYEKKDKFKTLQRAVWHFKALYCGSGVTLSCTCDSSPSTWYALPAIQPNQIMLIYELTRNPPAPPLIVIING